MTITVESIEQELGLPLTSSDGFFAVWQRDSIFARVMLEEDGVVLEGGTYASEIDEGTVSVRAYVGTDHVKGAFQIDEIRPDPELTARGILDLILSLGEPVHIDGFDPDEDAEVSNGAQADPDFNAIAYAEAAFLEADL